MAQTVTCTPFQIYYNYSLWYLHVPVHVPNLGNWTKIRPTKNFKSHTTHLILMPDLIIFRNDKRTSREKSLSVSRSSSMLLDLVVIRSMYSCSRVKYVAGLGGY